METPSTRTQFPGFWGVISSLSHLFPISPELIGCKVSDPEVDERKSCSFSQLRLLHKQGNGVKGSQMISLGAGEGGKNPRNVVFERRTHTRGAEALPK